MRFVSLLQRMREVMADTGWSAREWARRAGLPEESHVNTIMRRLRAKGGDDPKAMDLVTATKLAQAANVSLDWLALGRGTKGGGWSPIQPDPAYPSRAVAVVAARLAGWPRDGIDRVLRMNAFAADPGLEVWMGLLRAECDASREQQRQRSQTG